MTDDDGVRRRTRVVIATVAACTVVLAAAVTPAWVLDITLTDHELTGAPDTLVPDGLEPKPPARGDSAAWTPGNLPAWTALLPLVTLVVVVAVIFGGDLKRSILHLLSRRPPSTPPPTPGDGRTTRATDTSDLTDVVSHGLTNATTHLADPTRQPTDAVVAAWVALEDATSTVGIERRTTHTPSEYLLTVLDRTGADPGAAHELLTLYHRARFAHEQLTEPDRTAALHALTHLTRTLGTRPMATHREQP